MSPSSAAPPSLSWLYLSLPMLTQQRSRHGQHTDMDEPRLSRDESTAVVEHLPVGDGVIDCLISNCVINLSPEKPQVYREMNRVLRPGGLVSISDVIRIGDIPQELHAAQS